MKIASTRRLFPLTPQPAANTSEPAWPPECARVADNVFLSDDRPKAHPYCQVQIQIFRQISSRHSGEPPAAVVTSGAILTTTTICDAYVSCKRKTFIPATTKFIATAQSIPLPSTGDAYQHRVWIYDNEQSPAERNGWRIRPDPGIHERTNLFPFQVGGHSPLPGIVCHNDLFSNFTFEADVFVTPLT